MAKLSIIFRTKNDKVNVNGSISKIMCLGLQDYDIIVVDDMSSDLTLDQLLIFGKKTHVALIGYEGVVQLFTAVGHFNGDITLPKSIVGHTNQSEKGAGKNFNQGIDWAERSSEVEKFLIVYNFDNLNEIKFPQADIFVSNSYLWLTKKTRMAIGMFDPDKKILQEAIEEFVNRAKMAGMEVLKND